MSDKTEDGRQLRLLSIVDEYTRESLALEVDHRITAEDVGQILQYLFLVRGQPKFIRSGNGPEFVAKTVRRWLEQSGVGPLCIEPVSPWQNGYVESFNGKLRDESRKASHHEDFCTLWRAKHFFVNNFSYTIRWKTSVYFFLGQWLCEESNNPEATVSSVCDPETAIPKNHSDCKAQPMITKEFTYP